MGIIQRRIGIMGGTFDPIHYGHLLIAENAAVQYQLDQVVFMPTGTSPHKLGQPVTDSTHRCEMIRLAIADNPRFMLSTFEVQSGEVNYTYLTLEHLKQLHPQDEFYFILGGDSLRDFSSWRYPQRILQTAFVLAAIRDDIDGEEFEAQVAILNSTLPTPRVFCLNTPNFAVSSRKIRSLVAQGQTVRYMVPEAVRSYIRDYRLYRS